MASTTKTCKSLTPAWTMMKLKPLNSCSVLAYLFPLANKYILWWLLIQLWQDSLFQEIIYYFLIFGTSSWCSLRGSQRHFSPAPTLILPAFPKERLYKARVISHMGALHGNCMSARPRKQLRRRWAKDLAEAGKSEQPVHASCSLTISRDQSSEDMTDFPWWW